MRKYLILLVALSAAVLLPGYVRAADCSPATITNATVKDADGYMDSPILKPAGTILDFASKSGPMGVPDNNAALAYVGVNGSSGPYVFVNPKYFSIANHVVVASMYTLPLGLVSGSALPAQWVPRAITDHSLFSYFLTIEKSQIDSYSTGTITGTIYLAQDYLTSMSDSEIVTGTGTVWSKLRAVAGDNPTDGIWLGQPFLAENRVSCTVTIDATISKDLADAKKAGKMQENDVSGTLNGTDSTESVCGTPSLRSIISFALCTVLDAFITFLKALI